MRLQGLVLAGALLGAMMLTIVNPISGTMKAITARNDARVNFQSYLLSPCYIGF